MIIKMYDIRKLSKHFIFCLSFHALISIDVPMFGHFTVSLS